MFIHVFGRNGVGLRQSKDLDLELGVGVGWMFYIQNLTCFCYCHCFVVVDIWYQLVVMEQFVFGNGTWLP